MSSIGSKFHIVHGYKIKTKSKDKHSINASFREVNQICKMRNKKVRRRRLEEEEEKEEEDFSSSLSFSSLVFVLLISYLCHFRANLGNYAIFDLTKLIVSFWRKIS